MYKCSSCSYETPKFFGLCPKCKEGEGVLSAETSAVNITSRTLAPNRPKVELVRVNKDAKDIVASRNTKYPHFNSLISSSNGFVSGQVVLLAASPGIGKSTLCIAISDEKTLYISGEENFNQVNSRALRVNPHCNCEIFCSSSFEEIMSAIETTESDFVIVDSVNAIDFGVGYQTTARYVNEITELIKKLNKMCILISQVAKSGEISGMNSVQHIVDTVLYLERSEVSQTIIATSGKNRYGEIGSVCMFMHEADGFTQIDAEQELESSIGTTITKTRFGHKNMKIAIDSLVATSQSSFGLRKSNGYNQNRLVQLVGVLSYFGKLNLLDKDIYVNISNGLSTDDISIELAMANSILSSNYGIAVVREAYGEVRLNGKVINGNIDGKKIENISELIGLYSKKKER